MKHPWPLVIFSLFAGFLISCHAKPTNYPVEVGPAKFHRDYAQVQQLSKASGKPIFAFFQEVPG